MEHSVMEKVVRDILTHIGEDPDREGLRGTPDRVVRMWSELYRGYRAEPPRVATFTNGADGVVYDQMIIDTGEFYSTCEHHLMPFFGQYYFAYIPAPEGMIVGLSKVARVVDHFAARLQIQERLGRDIVDHLWNALTITHEKVGRVTVQTPPLGMAVVLKAEHLCKTMRGVKKKGTMTTAYLRGNFKEDESTRLEFMNYITQRP